MTSSKETPPSADTIRAMDDRHHLHPFTVFRELSDKGARVIERAEGCYIYDTDGKRILDGMAGLWCVNVGYGRERLARAAYEQMQKLPYYNTFFQTTTAPAAELAGKLAEILPDGMDRIIFNNSGSETNDTIIKTVWYYWNLMGKPEKKHFISRTLGYHGVGLGSASLTGMKFMHTPFDLPLERFHHIGNPYWFASGEGRDPGEFGLIAARWLEAKIKEIGADRVAAFYAEPIQGAGGVIIPPETYWSEIQRICRKHDILLVADEVICGFGRTGNWWGCETYDIQPDIIAMAKGLSSGYLPISAAALGRRVGDVIWAGESEYAHGVTYSGHPAAAAVALENIRIIEEEGLYSAAAGPVGTYFREQIATLADHPLVGEVRTQGFLAAIELVEDKATRRPYPNDRKVGYTCRELSIDGGLVMRAVRDAMILSPPLIIERHHVDEIVEKARQALDGTVEKLKLP
ncbi:MAG: aminotransferase class III-fold pyridoxal phosphate-dependent enzyme [Geminicoccaceae bacterium]|nr:aminotransferase class III-fold pyridoxal phosphate-dependent enzyme [Geminicoccaceae bacterium]